jgi:hypothetical protein
MFQCGLNIFGMGKSESMWESNKYCSDYFAETNISFYVNKLKTGHYYFNISFNPLDINKLRDNSSPIKFEYTVEIEKKGEMILKKTNSFFLEKAVTGRGDFLFDIPGNFLVNDTIQISIKGIAFDTLFPQYYRCFYFELQRNPFFSLR